MRFMNGSNLFTDFLVLEKAKPSKRLIRVKFPGPSLSSNRENPRTVFTEKSHFKSTKKDNKNQVRCWDSGKKVRSETPKV